MRKNTQKIRIGKIEIGGGAPVAVQSMTNTRTTDIDGTCQQIDRLVNAGCEIVRIAIPDQAAAKAFAEIRQAVPTVPLVADIHFDYRLALLAIDYGADKIRINPGNIGARDRIEKVIRHAQSAGIPIRVGVNAGSLAKDPGFARLSRVDALVTSALDNIRICEEFDFHDIVVSLKASDVRTTIQAYQKIAKKVDYPLHLGVTEAGTVQFATVKSSIALGTLLLKGIGDTIRISITGAPEEEIGVAWQILTALGLRRRGIEIVSCPTCGRTQIDLIALAKEVEQRLANVIKPLKVAVMGCAVNGPGEARDADIGIAGGNGCVLLFKEGKIIAKVAENKIVDELMRHITTWKT